MKKYPENLKIFRKSNAHTHLSDWCAGALDGCKKRYGRTNQRTDEPTNRWTDGQGVSRKRMEWFDFSPSGQFVHHASAAAEPPPGCCQEQPAREEKLKHLFSSSFCCVFLSFSYCWYYLCERGNARQNIIWSTDGGKQFKLFGLEAH